MGSKDNKKKARLALKALAQDEVQASSLVIITGKGHRVSKAIQLDADCGEPRVGWRYGTDASVTCKFCRDGTSKKDALADVPDRFPVVGSHRANDGLCFACGEEWPCATVIAELPVLEAVAS